MIVHTITCPSYTEALSAIPNRLSTEEDKSQRVLNNSFRPTRVTSFASGGSRTERGFPKDEDTIGDDGRRL